MSYKRLEYLETTNQQKNSTSTSDAAWIDTGIALSSTAEIECKMAFINLIPGSISNEALCGTTGAENTRFSWGFANYRDKSKFYVGLGSINLSTTVNRDTNVHVFKISAKDLTWAIDSTTGTFESPTIATGLSVTLFGRHTTTADDDTLINKPCDARVYYCKIWDNNELVRDLIPVLDENNIPCMWDKVTESYFYNKGQKAFTYKRPYCKELPYLESTATQYIDEDIVLNEGDVTDIYVDWEWTSPQVQSEQMHQSLSGCYNASGATQRSGYLYSGNDNGYFIRWCAGEDTLMTDIPTIESSGVRRQWHCFADDTNKIRSVYDFNENLLYTGSYEGTIASSRYNYIFGRGTTNNGAFSEGSHAKIYSWKRKINGVVVRDFIPVLDWNGNAAMYDKVSGNFFYNLGTGKFLFEIEESKPSQLMNSRLQMVLSVLKERNYTLLKYLEGDGNAYINTGYTAGSKCKFEIAWTPTSSTTTSNLCGTVTPLSDNESDRFQIVLNGSNHQLGVGLGSGYHSFSASSSLQILWQAGTTYVTSIDANYASSSSKKPIYHNGVEVKATSGSYTNSVTENQIYLFNSNSQPVRPCAAVQVHSFRIFDNNILVRDMIPVLDNDGIPCMWDKINDTLYYNAGTGSFKYERADYIECDYIHADGTAYINPYNYGDKESAVEGLVRSTDGTTLRAVLGTRTSNTSNSLCVFWPREDNNSEMILDFGSYTSRLMATNTTTNNWVEIYNDKIQRWAENKDTGVTQTNTTAFTGTFNTTPDPLYIGRAISSATGCQNFVGDYKYVKYWQNEVLIRDLIPVIDGNNVAGLYDKCLNIVFTSVA